ncbi:MAG: RHS domain-containing protein, partial [Ectothiorhodospiraceae bacterium]|nr:RHS domain-containing protein [Ectothiorhodospiraceae bacterium]
MVRISTFLFCLLLSFTQLAGATESVTYYHNDALGSPVAATDEDGELLWEQGYNPWGEPLQPTDDNERWFTGAPYEDASGLTYLQARWHSPAAGRFLAIDPVDFHEGNIHSFNRYAYGANNPYVYVDPDGNIPVPVIIWGAVKLGSAAITAYETYQAYENAGAGAAVGTAAVGLVGGPVRQA